MDGKNLRVLVVDDNRIPRQLLATFVKRAGWQLIEAGNGHAGLTKALELHPDIIVTSSDMPRLGGLEMARQIKTGQAGYRPYIILVTDLTDEEQLAEALDSSIDDFIGKPLRAEIFAARLRAAQRLIRLQRANEHHLDALQQYSGELAHSKQRLRELATMDELTGLPNRRYAMEKLRREWLNSVRDSSPLSCISIDLDGLKLINDTHGHERGDVVLKTVAATIREVISPQDTACRIGSDEFLVICPGESLGKVLAYGECLIRTIGSFGIHTKGCPFGLSIGVGERRIDIQDPIDLIRLSQQNMYHAKQHGKNQLYSSQEDRWVLIQGVNDACLICRTRGRTARGAECVWRKTEVIKVLAPAA